MSTIDTIAHLESTYESNVRTAAYCRQRQYTAPVAQQAAYESMANQAARKATKCQQQIDILKARESKRKSCRETDEFLAAWK